MKGQNVDILACCPGIIDTPGFRSTSPSLSKLTPKPVGAEQVAKEALANLGKKAVHIPGRMNRLSYFVLTRLLNGSWAAKIVDKTILRMYKNRFG